MNATMNRCLYASIGSLQRIYTDTDTQMHNISTDEKALDHSSSIFGPSFRYDRIEHLTWEDARLVSE